MKSILRAFLDILGVLAIVCVTIFIALVLLFGVMAVNTFMVDDQEYIDTIE